MPMDFNPETMVARPACQGGPVRHDGPGWSEAGYIEDTQYFASNEGQKRTSYLRVALPQEFDPLYPEPTAFLLR